ncbi:MAG: sugar-transfer associated ATP-grasp domain-containing protein [Patescibacteria group bacterium]
MSFVKPSQILGMNARAQLYTSLNSAHAKKFGFSKLKAKNFLRKHGIGVPELYAVISSREELRKFDWKKIEGAFAIKPINGSAGKGILVIKDRNKRKRKWIDIEGNEYSESDLNFHTSDILEGQYTTWGNQYAALIEERVPVHPDLEPHIEVGTPDVRIILFNKIPVMAMIRLPTKESQGRANLDQGAIAIGIDLGTGKSVYGVSGKKEIIQTIPKSGHSVAGIEVPYWKQCLKTAVRVANATGYVFMGVDLFVHPEKGPMVAEVNGFPGLSIQLANRAGLRRRLQRIEGMEAKNVNQAVKIGQSLFAENYPAQGDSDLDLIILDPKEPIMLFGDGKQEKQVTALINTGRYRSAISADVASELGLVDPEDLLWKQVLDDDEKVPVVEVKYKIRERTITTTMAVSKRLSRKRNSVEIGRKDLTGFLVAGER